MGWLGPTPLGPIGTVPRWDHGGRKVGVLLGVGDGDWSASGLTVFGHLRLLVDGGSLRSPILSQVFRRIAALRPRSVGAERSEDRVSIPERHARSRFSQVAYPRRAGSFPIGGS